MARRRDEDMPLAGVKMLEIVANQLRDGKPPETRQTYDRLVSEGYSDEDARRLIACVVASEVWHVIAKKEVFNAERFIRALNRLPVIPED